MLVYCVDDTPIHLNRIHETINLSFEAFDDLRVITFSDANKMLDQAALHAPALVTLDINMPRLDGLSALIKLKRIAPACKVVMVTAETETVIKRLATHHRFDANEEKKQELLSRVVERVELGKKEAGKINSVLEACATLGMDPVQVARTYGASAFLSKPYTVEQASTLINRLI